VAKKLGRRYLGFDLSKEYVARGKARLKGIRVGDPLDGAAEPLVSAPATPPAQEGANGRRRRGSPVRGESKGRGALLEEPI
jgi:site-specific DNA-methyltransferase (adenine-specific)